MNRLSGDYIRGYTAALMDVRDLMPGVMNELRRVRRRLDAKHWGIVMGILIEHRAEFRERGGFIRWNFGRKELEWYAPEERQPKAGERGGEG